MGKKIPNVESFPRNRKKFMHTNMETKIKHARPIMILILKCKKLSGHKAMESGRESAEVRTRWIEVVEMLLLRGQI